MNRWGWCRPFSIVDGETRRFGDQFDNEFVIVNRLPQLPQQLPAVGGLVSWQAFELPLGCHATAAHTDVYDT